MMSRILFLNFIICFIVSCQDKAHNKNDFFQHYQGDDFVKSYKVGEYEVTSTYQSPYFLACKDLGYTNGQKIDSVLALYQGGVQFVVDIESDNGLLIESILNSHTNQVVEQQLKKSFFLVYDDYEQKPSFVHMVRGSLVANKVQLLLCFSKQTPAINDVTLVYKDYLFGVGQLNYNYSLQDIRELKYPFARE